MWTRRDYLTLVTAAVATFSLTVASLYTQTVHAVDEKPAATTDVKVPTLNVSGAQVTAALDASKARTVVMTLTNTTAESITGQFAAQARVVGPSSRLSRVGPPQQIVWTENFAVELKPHETKTLSVELPEAAFTVSPTPPAPQPTPNGRPSPFGVVPGGSYFAIIGGEGPNVRYVQALTLASGAPAPNVTLAQPQTPAAKGTP